jgi:WS/DGAT/MGAT family acyltransferase
MPERLPGVDAGFLYMETPTQHMHTLKIAFLDVSSGARPYSYDVLEKGLAARLHLLPPFRRRLQHVPLRLHHPLWVEDRDVDLADHLHRVVVAAPGGQAEVEDAIARFAGTPLDRSKPLWEIAVLEGLADGRIAVVAKMHHAIADGVAASALLANVMDVAQPLEPVPFDAERLPPKHHLLLDALRALLHQLARLPALLVHTIRSVRLLAVRRRDMDVQPPRPILDTPRVSFTGAITARRSFAMKALSLEDFRAVRKAFGVSFNDVVLAVVAGALLRWLDAHDEHPDRPLTAGVPVATDGPDAPPRIAGNRVSNMFTSLCTDVADPGERLLAIAKVTDAAKVVQETLGLDMLQNWVQYTPPLPFMGFMRAYSRLRAADRHRAPFNVVVSNVPGPREPVYVGGARLTDLYSVGPILEGIGLNITVWSYCDEMAFSAIACPDTFDDLRSLVAGLEPALDELRAAARLRANPA